MLPNNQPNSLHTEIFKNLKLWIKNDNDEKIFLNRHSFSENTILFFNSDHTISGSLILSSSASISSVKLKISYHPDLSEKKGQNHLSLKEAAGIDIPKMPEIKRYSANYRISPHWCNTYFGEDISKIPENTQAILAEANNEYLFLLTTCDKEFKTSVKSNSDKGITVFAYSNYPQNDFECCAFILGNDKNPFELPRKCVDYGFEIMNKPQKTIKYRRYPDIFKYLGWCSWDAFHMDVSHDNLLEKATEFKDKNIPVRWLLIDDMWAECKNNNLKTMHSRQLYDCKADSKRFPGGLKSTINNLKSKFDLKIGVWYPASAYWDGVDPQGPFAKQHGDLLIMATNGRLLPNLDRKIAYEYFNVFNEYIKSCGADFIKVDNQSFLDENYKYIMPIGVAAKNMHEAIEASAGCYFDGNLINCMGLAIENFCNRPNSAIIRVSGDFKPENRKWFNQHLIQCSYNSFVQGCLYTGDWDMWWSDDGQAVKNAVLRAMSGGPVYVSDKLGRSIRDVIMPLVYSDGKIIRLENPAMPTKDCLVNDCKTSGSIFKIFNRIDKIGILAAFNIDENEKEVSGTISESDIYGLEDKTYLLYEYFSKTFEILNNTSAKLSLKNYDDFRLYFLLPYDTEKKYVPIGILDKYMSPATFRQIDDNRYIVNESGVFGVYSETKNIVIEYNGEVIKPKNIAENIFAFDLSENKKNLLIEFKLE